MPDAIQALARKSDVERAPHEAAAAVRADQVTGPDSLLTVRAGDAGGHALSVLRKARQLAAELRAASQLCQTLAHRSLGQELRRHQPHPVGLGWRRRESTPRRASSMASVRPAPQISTSMLAN